MYKVKLSVNAGGPKPVDVSTSLGIPDAFVTQNKLLMEMLKKAGMTDPLEKFDGQQAAVLGAALGDALEKIRADWETFEKMENENTIGFFRRITNYLGAVQAACVAAPDGVVNITV